MLADYGIKLTYLKFFRHSSFVLGGSVEVAGTST